MMEAVIGICAVPLICFFVFVFGLDKLMNCIPYIPDQVDLVQDRLIAASVQTFAPLLIMLFWISGW